MVEIGSVLPARVVRVEPYGVYLSHGNQTIIVLAPEVSWSAGGDLRDRVRVGEEFGVQVLRVNEKTGEVVGSIRRQHPEENPYRLFAGLEAGTSFRGQVTAVHADGATVRFPNGARGHVPRSCLGHREVKPGDEMDVTVSTLGVEDGFLTLDLASHDVNSSGRPPQSVTAESPR